MKHGSNTVKSVKDMANMTMRYFCQNCRREIQRKDRLVLRLEDPNAMFGQPRTIERAQVCRKCSETTKKYFKTMKGRLATVNRKVMKGEYETGKNG